MAREIGIIVQIKERSRVARQLPPKQRVRKSIERPPPFSDLRNRVLFNRAATKRPRNQAPCFFTHPIFESDFDCLTGKNRLHANLLLSL